MAEEEVGFRLALKNRREVERGIHEVGDEFERTGDEAARAGRKARTIGASGMVAFGRSGRLAGRAAVVGFGAASAAIVGTGIVLTKLSKDSIGEAREAQKVGAITRAEIEATGGAAKITAKHVGNLSGAISAKVGIDDEAIQSGANMILTFKNVRNEVGRGNKIFDRATKSAVDLSAAGFGSITSQSKSLAKALNDPVKGMSALGKSGVTFTAQQQDTIKSLVEQGDLLKAQKIILGEVESQVGGVAKSQATWGEKASVSMGNIKESIGTALLPELDKVEKWFVQKGAPVLENYVDIFERKGIPKIKEYAGIFVDRGIPAMQDFLDEARPLANSVLPTIGTGFDAIADATKVIAPRLKSIFDGFNGLPDWAQEAVLIGAGGAVVARRLGVVGAIGVGGGGGRGSAATGGRGAGITVGRAAVTLTAAYFAADAVTKLLGWEQAGPDAQRRDDDHRRKYGQSRLTSMEDANYKLFDRLGVSSGSGPFGLRRNDSGLADALGGMRPEQLKETRDWLRETYGIGFKILEQNDRLPEGFTKWANSGIRGIGSFNDHLRGVVDGTQQLDTGIGRAKNSTDQLLGALTGVDRPFRPRLTIDGLDPALAKVNSLRTGLLGLPGMGTPGNGLGVLLPTPSGKRPKPGKGSGGGVAPRLDFPNVDMPTIDDDFFDAGGFIGVDQRPVQLVLRDGRVIADVVVDDLGQREARR